jgi:U3 small nucleolar ribonucleoprotein component
MFRILAIAAAMLGVAAAAHADVYRWTDAQGEVHYSDKWVPGSTLIKGSSRTPTPPAQTEQQKLATSNASLAEQKAQRDTEQTVKHDVAASKAEQCKQATAAYDKAIQSRRIYKEGPNGTREYVNDQEADAYRAKLLNDRKQVCGQ